MVWPARLVTPAIVMVHEAVPLAIVTALKATVSRRALRHRRAAPQPALKVMVGAAEVQRKALGKDSVKAIPDCAGLVPCWSASR